MRRLALAVIITAMLFAASCGEVKDKNSSSAAANKVSDTTSAASVSHKTESSEKETGDDEEDVYDIKEKLFITTCNAIYMEPDSYMDKPIKIEGYCDIYDYEGATHYGVIRNGPGCCGNDGYAGFEFVYNGEYPASNDWIEVIGMLEYSDTENGNDIYIKAESVKVKTVRGNDTVAN